MNKNLNPLNWTKKQQIIGGAVAIVLIGGVTTGIVANANHKAEVRKIEQLSKEKVEKDKARAEIKKLNFVMIEPKKQENLKKLMKQTVRNYLILLKKLLLTKILN